VFSRYCRAKQVTPVDGTRFFGYVEGNIVFTYLKAVAQHKNCHAAVTNFYNSKSSPVAGNYDPAMQVIPYMPC